ncbi:hypothetical protein Tco_0182691, partial [Tanacetum coccineum]
PKVWSDAPIIKECESDSEDEYVSIPTKEQETPSFANQDCDFHEKRMAKQAVLNNRLKRNSTVLTRTIKIPVNTARASSTKNVSTARHSFNRQAILTSAAMKVNTVKPIVKRVNSVKVNAVSAIKGKRETAVKPSASCNWRP